MKIKMDTRENKDEEKKVLNSMKKYAEVEICKLDLGDFVTDKVLIERKSLDDLAGSVIMGRFYDQLNRLAVEQTRTNKVVALVVHDFYFKNPRLTMDQAEGAIASAMVRYGIPVLWGPNLETICRVSVKICEKVEEGKWLVPRQVWQPKRQGVPKIVTLVKRLFGVSETVAAHIIVDFGSIKNIAAASEEDLMNVPGIGPLRAKRIHTLLNQDWRQKKK
jgi:ERCC4-type nuclease